MTKKLVHCRICGAEMAANAKACPQCGAKNRKPIYKKWWFWVIVIFLLGGGFGASSDNAATTHQVTNSDERIVDETTEDTKVVDTSKKNDKNANQTEESINSNTHNIYKIGDVVSTNRIEMTVTKAEYWTGYDSYAVPDEGMEIYRCYFEIKNIGSSDLWVSYPECYADDVSCEYYFWGDGSFSWDSISTGRKAAGWAYYEVPKGAENIELEYESNIWTDDYIIFKIK